MDSSIRKRYSSIVIDQFHIQTMLFFLVIPILLQHNSDDLVNPTSFTFNSFQPQNCEPDGRLLCSTGVTTSGGYLDLNPDVNVTGEASTVGSVGRVLFKQPVINNWPAWFMTTFTVVIENNDTLSFGDGMGFFLVSNPGLAPTNSYGGFLGLFNHSTNGNTTNQLAIELDTYMNEFDPDDNHIAIDTQTIVSDDTSGDLASVGVSLKSGREVAISVVYYGQNNTLIVYAGYAGTPLMLVLNYTIDLPNTVQAPVYAGFVGSIAGASHEKHRIINWTLWSVPLSDIDLENGGSSTSGHAKTKKASIIGAVVAAVSVVVFAAVVLYPVASKKKVCKPSNERKMVMLRKKDLESRSRNAMSGPKLYKYKQLAKATKNFSEENILGAGGYGTVYRAELSDPPHVVAVKKITATSTQGEKEFLAEICTIGRLKHKNIVKLQGWCHERGHLLLVYEFMPNGSLDRYIARAVSLDWPTRRSILTGLASALLYLHEESGQHVIHRDVKPNNVLLDAEFNARLSDFGLARLLETENSVLTRAAGTPGYLAPECNYTGKATTESDVFSFGVVVLEVVCGRRSWGTTCLTGDNNLVDYVWGLHGKGELLQGVDSRLEGEFDKAAAERFLLVGLACVHPDPAWRPTIRKVVHVLTNANEPLMELPEARPAAIYVPLPSPTASAATASSATTSASASSSRQTQVPAEETVLEIGR